MKRWFIYRTSTRPQTLAKCQSDVADLHWLVDWLAKNDMTIEFDQYQGKSKEELMVYMRAYREAFSGDADLMQPLMKAMKPSDWDSLLKSTKTV